MRVDFSNLSLKNEIFDRSNVKGAIFDSSDLNDTSFEEVICTLFYSFQVFASGASFKYCKASKAIFTQANLKEASFEHADCYAGRQ
jgi:uncharacterized protein YjbI with pentapeptide repeats